jgi:aminopeptidase N
MRTIVRHVIGASTALVALAGFVRAQSPLAIRADTLALRHDALHYDVSVTVPDTGAWFSFAVATQWRITSADSLRIEIDSGFAISAVERDGKPQTFARRGDVVLVPHARRVGDTVTTLVRYAGRPRDGIAVSTNVYGERTVFADDWPDRAHHWLASQDHPGDKATADFHVTVRRGLRALANGVLVKVDSLPDGTVTWHYHIAEPIPVYTMVFAAGNLAVATLPPAACAVKCVPISVVTYPADSAFAVSVPFAPAGAIVDYFSTIIGPFPFERLSHVESTTIFGGMENSSAIFYDAKGYNKRTMRTHVVAHETAHQWFGDAATEADWHHLWLSEGFATYLTALWIEHADGVAARNAQLKEDADRVFASTVTERPIIDPNAKDLMGLLNTNDYQKGGWVLHSLRGLIGDSAFFAGLRAYYANYKYGVALSSDFARTMEAASHRDLEWYFLQALTQPGYPVLAVAWRHKGTRLTLDIAQTQKPAWQLYRMPGLVLSIDGRRVTVDVSDANTHTVIEGVPAPPKEIVVDPDGWWLMKSTVTRAQ